MKWIFSSLFALCMLSGTAQEAMCEIYTVDSTGFTMTVDGQNLGDSLYWHWQFKAAPGKHTLNLFPDDAFIKFIDVDVELTAGVNRAYQVLFVDNRTAYVIGIASESAMTPELASGPSVVQIAPIADSLALTVNAVLLEDPEFTATMKQVRKSYLQSERLKLIEGYLKDHKVEAEELRTFLGTIDAEDRRLDLALSAADKLRAPAKLSDFTDLFFFESSKEKLLKASESEGE